MKNESKTFIKDFLILLVVFLVMLAILDSCFSQKPKTSLSLIGESKTVQKQSDGSAQSAAAAPAADTGASSSAGRKTSYPAKRKTEKSDPYDAGDYAHPDDFYYDHYDDFADFEDAESYWDENG